MIINDDGSFLVKCNICGNYLLAPPPNGANGDFQHVFHSKKEAESMADRYGWSSDGLSSDIVGSSSYNNHACERCKIRLIESVLRK